MADDVAEGYLKVGSTGKPEGGYESGFKRETQALNLQRRSLEHSMLFYTEKAKQLSRNKYNLQIILTGGPKANHLSGLGSSRYQDINSQDDADYTFPNYKNRVIRSTRVDGSLHEPDVVRLYIGKPEPTDSQAAQKFIGSEVWETSVQDFSTRSDFISHERELQRLTIMNNRPVLPNLPYVPSTATRRSIELRATPAVIHNRDPDIDIPEDDDYRLSRRSLPSARGIKPRPDSRSLDRNLSTSRRITTGSMSQDNEFNNRSKEHFYIVTGKSIKGEDEDKSNELNPIQIVEKANKKIGRIKKLRVIRKPRTRSKDERVTLPQSRHKHKGGDGAWAKTNNNVTGRE